MYFKEEGFVDLNEIKKKIKVAAFENEFEMVGREIPSVWFEGDYNQRNSFINEYTRLLWEYLRKKRSNSGKNSFENMQDSISARLKEIKKYLLELGFREKAVKNSIELLADDQANGVDELVETPKSGHFLAAEKPLENTWKITENDIIHEIRTLYDDYTPLAFNEYQIAYNMALVFSAVGFWDSDGAQETDKIETYFHKIRNLFQNNAPG